MKNTAAFAMAFVKHPIYSPLERNFNNFESDHYYFYRGKLANFSNICLSIRLNSDYFSFMYMVVILFHC